MVRSSTRLILQRPVLATFLFALSIRVIAIFGMSLVFASSPVLDDLTYAGIAEDAARGDTAHWDEYTSGLYESTATFLIPLAFIYRVFGADPLHGQLFVALLGASAAAGVTRLGLALLPRIPAVLGGAIVALLPSQVLWSSLILKDAAAWLLLILLALVVIKAGGAGRGQLFALGPLFLLLLTALAYVRIHTFIVACWAIALTAWAGGIHFRWHRVAVGASIALFLPWVLGVGPLGIDFIRESGNPQGLRAVHSYGARSAVVPPPAEQSEARNSLVIDETSKRVGLPPEKVNRIVEEASSLRIAARPGGPVDSEDLAHLSQETGVSEDDLSQVLNDFQVQRIIATKTQPFAESAPADSMNPVEANLSYLPKGIALMLFAPLPWHESTSSAMTLAQYETAVWYPLLLLAIIGLPIFVRNFRRTAFILVLGGGILLMYALGEGNIGTAYRHRGEFTWIIGISAVYGMLALRDLLRKNGQPTSEEQGAIMTPE